MMARQMKDSGVEWIGQVPKDWTIKRLKYVCDTRKEKYDRVLGELDYFGLENVVSETGEFISTSNEYDLEQSQLCMKNDVVFGKLRPYLAKVFLVDKNRCCSSEFAVFTNFDGISVFYKYLFLSCGFIKVVDASTYGTKMPRVNIDFMNNMFISVPPLTEQQRIAGFLDEKVGEIDSVIKKTKETIEDYKRYKQAIITDVVTKGLNPDVEMKESKLQWVDTIPIHWKENKILHIISMPVIDGPHVSPELVDSGVPYISADAIENGKINFDRKRGFITEKYSEECNKRYKPQKNDILVVKLGASTGKMAIVGDDTNFNIWVPLAVVRCKKGIISKYIFYSMESSYFKNEIRNGWSFGTQETLGVKTLEQLIVFVPPLEEQKEIVAYLDEKCSEIDNLITKKEELLVDLESYKKSLIFEYVTGKRECK